MVLKSYSKINLSLNINRKLIRLGLHDIRSYFCLINLYDEIKVNKIKRKRDIIKFKGKFAKDINIKHNSILETLKILRQNGIISHTYSILINKKIPVFSGLGGGTGNAFFLANYLTKNKISASLIKIFDKRVGTDFKLFLYKKGFIKNLDKIKKIRLKSKLYFMIVYPNFKCSTKYVYSKVKKYSPKLNHKYKHFNDKNKFLKFMTYNVNELQPIVEKKYPILRKIIKEIRVKKDCYFSRMTGSGSVCYGVFKSEKAAKKALNLIKLKYPNYWGAVAKTI